MIYIDRSSLLKTLWQEPESAAVREAIGSETLVVVSALAELETEVQLRAKWLGGAVTKARYEAYRSRLASFRDTAPSALLPAFVLKRFAQPELQFDIFGFLVDQTLELMNGPGSPSRHPFFSRRFFFDSCIVIFPQAVSVKIDRSASASSPRTVGLTPMGRATARCCR